MILKFLPFCPTLASSLAELIFSLRQISPVQHCFTHSSYGQQLMRAASMLDGPLYPPIASSTTNCGVLAATIWPCPTHRLPRALLRVLSGRAATGKSLHQSVLINAPGWLVSRGGAQCGAPPPLVHLSFAIDESTLSCKLNRGG